MPAVTLTDNNFIEYNAANPFPVTTGTGDLPQGAVALQAGSANVANSSAAAILTGTPTTTVWLTGFQVTGSGATAGLPVPVTVTGLLGGTRSFIYTFELGVAVGNTPLQIAFWPPLPASGVNQAIAVNCPASGAGGLNNCVTAQGFYR